MPAAPQPHAGHPALPLGPCPRRVPEAGRSALPAAVKPGNGPRGTSSRCPRLPARETDCATGLHDGGSPLRRQPAARLAGSPVSRSWPRKGCMQRTDVLGVQSLGGPPVGDCARVSAPVQAVGLCFVFAVRARPRSSGAKMLLPLRVPQTPLVSRATRSLLPKQVDTRPYAVSSWPVLPSWPAGQLQRKPRGGLAWTVVRPRRVPMFLSLPSSGGISH